MTLRRIRTATTLAAGLIAALAATGTAAAAPSVPKGYSIRAFASGATLTNPDDVARLAGRIYVAYQNATTATGTGGESTIVAYKPR